jgi:hypothetical protein
VTVDSKVLAYERYGPYREDGFYLVPVGPMTRAPDEFLKLTAIRS